jgi:hypothetical protein
MKRTLLFAASAAVMGAAAPALAQAGGAFDLTWNTLDGGGGASISGSFKLQGTIGQPDAGVMSSGAYRLIGGFWGGAGGSPPCAADFNADGAVSSQDFFDFLSALFVEAPAADFNHDGVVTSQDFFDFIVAFFAGC